jgi:hypothetical protein
MELTKLARVRVDMPNELDEDWKIDVRKSSAHPPRHVRDRLRRVIETIGAGSKRVYTSRGRRLWSESRVPVWQRLQDKNEIRYELNREHPVLAEFVEKLADPLRREFMGIVEMIGAAIPVEALFADMGAQPEHVAGAEMSSEVHERVVIATFQHLLRSGLSVKDVVEMLRVTEPFRSNWGQTDKVVQGLVKEAQAHE